MQLTGDYYDPKAGTAFEFHRQMKSPNLTKINPDFECSIEDVRDKPPSIRAEYKDGFVWEKVDISEYKINTLRNDFFEHAFNIEDEYEIDADGDDGDASGGKKADPKAGGKAGAPAGKK